MFHDFEMLGKIGAVDVVSLFKINNVLSEF